MPRLFIPATITKFPPEITVTPPTPTLLSPKGSISEETKQRLKVRSLPLNMNTTCKHWALHQQPVWWSTQQWPLLSAPYRTLSCPPSLPPQWKRTLWASRYWRCRRHPARSHLWRASQTRRTITWTSESPRTSWTHPGLSQQTHVSIRKGLVSVFCSTMSLQKTTEQENAVFSSAVFSHCCSGWWQCCYMTWSRCIFSATCLECAIYAYHTSAPWTLRLYNGSSKNKEEEKNKNILSL